MKLAPFDITPNPRFLFHSNKHREAFNHLLYGIRERKGFVQLTGEVGAGKTTLCRALLEHLDGRYSTALILNPVLSGDEMMKAIATEFGLEVKGRDRLETIATISDFLLKQTLAGKETVLIVDEAQNLTEDLLEQVRLISNIETDDRKLLQIVLMGQPELRDRLGQYTDVHCGTRWQELGAVAAYLRAMIAMKASACFWLPFFMWQMTLA